MILSLALLLAPTSPLPDAALPASAVPPATICARALQGADEPERLEAWPKLEDAALAKREVARLRKARTEEMGAQAHAALVELGAGCAPLLMTVVEKEKGSEARARAVAVLELVTDARHTRLIAEGFTSRSASLRTWSLGRTAAFPDPRLQAAAESALTAARKRKAKKGEEDELDAERRAAALAATASGSLDGLPELTALARDDWGDWGSAVRTALEGARGPEASAAVVATLAGERRGTVAGLRLLAGCGDASALAAVGQHLDSSDNSIRIEAINACRGIVDGDPPLARLSAFEAIEVAKKWKGRL